MVKEQRNDKNRRELEKFARNIGRLIFITEHGVKEKPNFWVCGNFPISTSDKTKCYYCNKVIYFDRENIRLFDKNHKKVCGKCCLEKLDITNNERKLLEKVEKIKS